MISTNHASAAASADSKKSAERADHSSDDEKKARRSQFLTGLKASKTTSGEARPNAGETARAKGQSVVGEEANPASRTEAKASRTNESDGRTTEAGSEAASEGSAEKGPEDGLVDILVRRGVVQNARRVLRQRVSEHAPKLADANPAEARTSQPRDVEAEQKLEKKSVVEAAQKDPEAAIVSGMVPTEATAVRREAPVVPLRTDHPVTPATFRQMVAFAEVHTDRTGMIEFKLGLKGTVLAGAKIVIRSFGNRKIGLRIANSTEAAAVKAVSKNDVSELVEALRKRDLDVVDVEVI